MILTGFTVYIISLSKVLNRANKKNLVLRSQLLLTGVSSRKIRSKLLIMSWNEKKEKMVEHCIILHESFSNHFWQELKVYLFHESKYLNLTKVDVHSNLLLIDWLYDKSKLYQCCNIYVVMQRVFTTFYFLNQENFHIFL